jgi:hypothetical protein
VLLHVADSEQQSYYRARQNACKDSLLFLLRAGRVHVCATMCACVPVLPLQGHLIQALSQASEHALALILWLS